MPRTPVAFFWLFAGQGLAVHLCYIDESGTSAVPGNSSHFILAGIAVPIGFWKHADAQIAAILAKFRLKGAELHTAWLLRPYLEQTKIPNFSSLSDTDRIRQMSVARNKHLLELQRSGKQKAYRQTKKNYKNTEAYVHLTYEERKACVIAVADEISSWADVKLFCECIDKIYQDSSKTGRSIDEQAFEQVVSRFEHYLVHLSGRTGDAQMGLLVHDNNETVSHRHTTMMRDFHAEGTLWNRIEHIIETPLFVDSKLTSMVQIADLCSYAIRRYLENGEEELFARVFKIADRNGDYVLGARHFTDYSCACHVCKGHRRSRRSVRARRIGAGVEIKNPA